MDVIDLNCDMGESFGAWTMGSDAEMLKIVSSANVACGFHGGDPLVMFETVTRAKDFTGKTIVAEIGGGSAVYHE